MTAIVTSANSLKALTVIRCLGKNGIYIMSADKKGGVIGSKSKYSKEFFIYPDPITKEQEFIQHLLLVLKKKPNDVLIPVHSEDTYVISKYKSKLERYTKIPYMDYDTINSVNNKSYFLKEAQDIGMPIPKTFHPTDFESLRNCSRQVTYPAVIKLRNSSSSIGLSYVNTPDELIAVFKQTILKFSLREDDYPIIQEYIKGDGYGVSFLFNQGDIRAIFTHKRLREYPISGGPSTCRISLRHPQMEKIATDLLEHYSWHGVAMVEFKLTDEGKPVLMEVNPRFWGSVNQAVQSGVDFPNLLYTMAVEGDVKPVLNYHTGVKTRNVITDTVALYQYLKKTNDPGLLKEFFSCPFTDDILSLNDPLPVFSYIKKAIGEMRNSRYN